MTRWLANLIDRFLNSLAPIRDLDCANWLADYEAESEVFEPDELWAARARHRQPADTRHASPESSTPQDPAQAGQPPRVFPPSGVGGPEFPAEPRENTP